MPAFGFIGILIVGALLVQTGLLAGLDQKILDAQFQFSRWLSPEHVSNDPVIVGIDQRFLDGINEPLAFNHVYLASFLRAMREGGPRVIGLDIEMPEKRFDTLRSSTDPQLDFHKTLLAGLLETVRQIPVVTAKVYDQDRSRFRDIQTDYAAVLGMQNDRQGMASAMFCPDSDGFIRRYPGKDCQPGQGTVTFSSEISAAAGVRQDWSGLINFRLGDKFAYTPLQNVLKLAAQGKTSELKEQFNGRIVLLGSVLENHDLLDLAVPLAAFRPTDTHIPGVLAHAQILRSMMNRGFIQPASRILVFAVCALFALLWFGESVIAKFLIFLLSMAGLLVLSGFLLRQSVWLPPGAAMLTGVLAFGGRSACQGWRHFSDKQRLKRVFSGYVSPVIMREIIDGRIDANQASRRLAVCVLVADIRNFTTLSERLQAEEVVGLLNRYFTRMVAVIHQHGGTVDKFMGDGLLAFFGAPNALACPERNGLDAAHGMLAALSELNCELLAEGRAALRIGVGLHSGEAVIGHIGSAERFEYTAIGDTVNIASRIEGLCKQLDSPIVCSETVVKAAGYPADMVNLGDRPLKGHSPIIVYGWRTAMPVPARTDAP
jgi:class 3 adenylate cyclase/CHASE2 domain-containing sensor protein